MTTYTESELLAALEWAVSSIQNYDRYPTSQEEFNTVEILTALRERIVAGAVAWMYNGEPWFDGEKWHTDKEVTISKSLAMFKNKNSAIPLYNLGVTK